MAIPEVKGDFSKINHDSLIQIMEFVGDPTVARTSKTWNQACKDTYWGITFNYVRCRILFEMSAMYLERLEHQTALPPEDIKTLLHHLSRR